MRFFIVIFHPVYFLKMIIGICILMIQSDEKDVNIVFLQLLIFFMKKKPTNSRSFLYAFSISTTFFLLLRLFSFLTLIPNDCFTYYFSSFSCYLSLSIYVCKVYLFNEVILVSFLSYVNLSFLCLCLILKRFFSFCPSCRIFFKLLLAFMCI